MQYIHTSDPSCGRGFNLLVKQTNQNDYCLLYSSTDSKQQSVLGAMHTYAHIKQRETNKRHFRPIDAYVAKGRMHTPQGPNFKARVLYDDEDEKIKRHALDQTVPRLVAFFGTAFSLPWSNRALKTNPGCVISSVTYGRPGASTVLHAAFGMLPFSAPAVVKQTNAQTTRESCGACLQLLITKCQQQQEQSEICNI